MKLKQKTFKGTWWNDSLERTIAFCRQADWFHLCFPSEYDREIIDNAEDFIDRIPLRNMRVELHHFEVKGFGGHTEARAYLV